MKKITFLLIIGIFFSCKNNKETTALEKKLKPYVISIEDSLHAEELKKKSIESPFIPAGISGESNLVIDKNGDFYYYQTTFSTSGCGTGIENDTIPKYIGLQPKDLIKIPKESLEKFVDENVMKKSKNRRILIMASQNDTIKEKSFLKFIHTLKIPTYVIRRTTQEEDTVLHYKKNNGYYFSDEIKWDKTKIKLRN